MNTNSIARRGFLGVLLWLGMLGGLLPARAAADELWEAVFRLGDGDEAVRAAARQALLEAGPQGFKVTLVATRLLCDAALPTLARHLDCHMLSFQGGPTWSFPNAPLAPAYKAAEVLAELIREDPTLAEGLLESPVAFERKVGLLGLVQAPERLVAALDRLQDELDTSVVEFARGVVPCATLQAHGDRGLIEALTRASLLIRARREEMLPPTRCEEAGFSVGPVLDGLVSGKASANGWQRENHVLSVMVRMPDGVRVLLSPRCAFDLYDAAVRQQRHIPGLIMPFVEELTLDPRDREEALRRAERDILSFPEEDRNRQAARLVNAGGRSAHPVTFDAEDPFAQEELLEAAARQGQPRAWQVIEQATFCRGDFSDQERIELLGFVGTAEAANTAAELARRCPRARGAAVVALLRLHDRRAADHLAAALESPGFAHFSLERALLEHLTPEVTRALVRAAAGKGIGSSGAQQALERLRAAGKIE